MPLSVTEPIKPVPLDWVIAISAPPEITLLPLVSFTVTVSTCVLVPLAVMVALPGVSVDWSALFALTMEILSIVSA